ncbi:MAG: hypothetical protein SFW09_13125 [Hyphomicrobiaceae bacterium]|nr:hypothetical protein [Hyphomicrobiaceae bacterium]
MTDVRRFEPGGYRTIPGVFQYSGGVAAEPGFAIERVTFRRQVPLAEGFARVEAHLTSIGRPLTAFCACELRSPGQFSEAGFIAFNQHYCETLAKWGIYDAATKFNPVARSNVCPLIGAPAAPGFYAFSYTVPAPREAMATFVNSGSGEAPEGKGAYGNHIVRRGETSPDAMADKARAVLGEMERRMRLLGFDWSGTTATQVYTVHDIHGFLGSEVVARGAARNGVTWHLARPPVVELEYEMDCRAIAIERVL